MTEAVNFFVNMLICIIALALVIIAWSLIPQGVDWGEVWRVFSEVMSAFCLLNFAFVAVGAQLVPLSKANSAGILRTCLYGPIGTILILSGLVASGVRYLRGPKS